MNLLQTLADLGQHVAQFVVRPWDFPQTLIWLNVLLFVRNAYFFVWALDVDNNSKKRRLNPLASAVVMVEVVLLMVLFGVIMSQFGFNKASLRMLLLPAAILQLLGLIVQVPLALFWSHKELDDTETPAHEPSFQ